jgi:hypothetical protein
VCHFREASLSVIIPKSLFDEVFAAMLSFLAGAVIVPYTRGQFFFSHF